MKEPSMKMHPQAIAALAALCFGTAASPAAHAIGCPIWMCGTNGTQLSGISPHDLEFEGIELQGTDISLPEVEKAEDRRVPEPPAAEPGSMGKPQVLEEPGAE
jgi:hypothetical protein